MALHDAPRQGTDATFAWWAIVLTWLLVPVLVALDQWSKNFIVSYYYLWEVDPVIGEVLRLTRVHNQGAAFGVLQQWPGLFKYLTAFAILALTTHKVLTRNRGLLYHAALGFVLSGAIGNFIDRIRYNHVVDFIQVGFNGWYWPSFNVADSAITVGVVLLLWGSFTETGTDAEASSTGASADAELPGDKTASPGATGARHAKDQAHRAEARP